MTMLAVLVVAGVLMQTPQQAAPPREQARADAIASARQGRYQEALDAFSRLVADDPADHDARVWIGRLQAWTGKPDLSEATYRAVLRENAHHVDAMVGLASTLMLLGRLDEAANTLSAAQKEAPDNPDVLAALARVNRRMGRLTPALACADRAAALAPTDENLLAREQVRREYGHRVEVGGFNEQLEDSPNAPAGDIAINLRVHDRVRLFARGQAERKSGATEGRGGAGLELRAGPATTLVAFALFGPGNVVLAEADANVEASHTTGRFEWIGGYRFIQFATARVSVLSPGVTVWNGGGTFALTGRYYLALTGYTNGAPLQATSSALLRVSFAVRPRIWVNTGYAYGTENYETYTADRVGEFQADTASAGIRFDLRTLTSLSAGYEYQWRSNGMTMSRLTLAAIQRF